MVAEYGKERSEVILAAIRAMMGGNVIGLPYSALQSRFKAKVRYTNSSLFYEIGMSLAPLLLIPVALLHHLLRRIVSLFH